MMQALATLCLIVCLVLVFLSLFFVPCSTLALHFAKMKVSFGDLLMVAEKDKKQLGPSSGIEPSQKKKKLRPSPSPLLKPKSALASVPLAQATWSMSSGPTRSNMEMVILLQYGPTPSLERRGTSPNISSSSG